MLYIALIIAILLLWIFVRAYKNKYNGRIIKTMSLIGIALNIFNVVFILYTMGR